MVTTETAGFIDWLCEQHLRSDMVGELARSIRGDPRSATLRTPLDLSKRLNQDEASWEYHDAPERAESEWAAAH